MEDKEIYLQELELELHELSSKIDALKAYLLEDEDGMTELDVDILDEKEEEAHEKLEALKSADEDSWEDRKEEVEEAVEELLRQAVESGFTIT